MLLFKEVVDRVVLVILIFPHLFQIFLKMFLAILDLVDQANLEKGRRSNRGNDLRYDISIDLDDAFKGKEEKINYTTYKKCKTCAGSGAKPGSKPTACSYCGGQGRVRSNQGFFTIQQTCPECSGEGEQITILAVAVVEQVKLNQMNLFQ